MNGTIYMLLFPNGKKYVGQTRGKLTDRLNAHRRADNAQVVSIAIRKHGWENIETLTLAKLVTTKSELNRLERHYIWFHNSLAKYGRGYNMSPGIQATGQVCSRRNCYEKAEALGMCGFHYRQDNWEKRKLADPEFLEKHNAYNREAYRRRVDDDPEFLERQAEKARRYRAEPENRARYNARERERREANPQAARDYSKTWWNNPANAEKVAAIRQRKNAKRRAWTADPANAAAKADANAHRRVQNRLKYRMQTAPQREAKRQRRQSAIDMFADGSSRAEIAKQLGVHPHTVTRWVKT